MGFSNEGDWNICWEIQPLASKTSSAWHKMRGRSIPAGTSTGLPHPGGCAAACPGPAAWWQDWEGHQCGADLSLRWGVVQLLGEGGYNPWHNHRGCGVFQHCWGSAWRLFPQQSRRLVEGYWQIYSLILLCIPPSWPCESSWRNVLSVVRAGCDWRGSWL